VEHFRAFAARRGVTPSALALAWVLSKGDHLIPIPGTRTAEHLRDWGAASTLDLTLQDHAEIDRILPVGWANGDRYGHDQAATAERYC
jgi:aryl-alcohol dehydrogenase-like predicted oxidoreductase